MKDVRLARGSFSTCIFKLVGDFTWLCGFQVKDLVTGQQRRIENVGNIYDIGNLLPDRAYEVTSINVFRGVSSSSSGPVRFRTLQQGRREQWYNSRFEPGRKLSWSGPTSQHAETSWEIKVNPEVDVWSILAKSRNHPETRKKQQSTENQKNTKHQNIIWVGARCQAKFLTCEISDFTPCAHAQSDILHIKYAEKTDDQG